MFPKNQDHKHRLHKIFRVRMSKGRKVHYRQYFFLNLNNFVARALFLMAKCQEVMITVFPNTFSFFSLQINFIVSIFDDQKAGHLVLREDFLVAFSTNDEKGKVFLLK